jgi:hypothetical protein
MDFQLVVMFIDSFMDDITYVRDVEVCVGRMIRYIPGCICYGSENFGFGSLHDDYVEFCKEIGGTLLLTEGKLEDLNLKFAWIHSVVSY